MSRKEVSLCISCVGGTLVPAALELLRQSDRFAYRLIGINAAPAPLAEGLLDSFHLVPRGDDPGYVSALLDVVRQERPDVLLPWSDDEAVAMSSAAPALESLGTRVLASSAGCLARIADKRVTYENLRNAGLAVPDFFAVTDVDGLKRAAATLGYPERTVVVKPSRGRGGRGLQVLVGADGPPDWLGKGQRETRWTREDLSDHRIAAFFEHGRELLVMPRLGVPAYDADVVTLGGDPLVVVRRRHNPAGIPFAGNTVMADRELTDYCRRVAMALELEAVHDIDIMTTADGRAVVLEVNPRPSGSLAAGMAAGLPILDWAVERALGGNPGTYGIARDTEVRPVIHLRPTLVGGNQA